MLPGEAKSLTNYTDSRVISGNCLEPNCDTIDTHSLLPGVQVTSLRRQSGRAGWPVRGRVRDVGNNCRVVEEALVVQHFAFTCFPVTHNYLSKPFFHLIYSFQRFPNFIYNFQNNKRFTRWLTKLN